MSIFPRFSLLGILSLFAPGYFAEEPACPCCRIKRLMRWIRRSMRKNPEAWKWQYAGNATQGLVYQKEPSVSVRPEGKWRIAVSVKDLTYHPGPFRSLWLRYEMNKLAGDQIAKQVFGW